MLGTKTNGITHKKKCYTKNNYLREKKVEAFFPESQNFCTLKLQRANLIIKTHLGILQEKKRRK